VIAASSGTILGPVVGATRCVTAREAAAGDKALARVLETSIPRYQKLINELPSR
jgi:hypothetical protein